MNITDEQRNTIAGSWYRAIADTLFTDLRESEVRSSLVALTKRVIILLQRAPLERAAAQAIGATLAQLGNANPTTLARTQQMLAQEPVLGLSVNDNVALQPQLAGLLGELAAGFFKQARAMILDEQEQSRTALVTELVQVEGALRQSEARFRTIFEGAAIGIVRADLRGHIIESNPAIQQMLGYSRDTLHGLNFTVVTHPDDVAMDVELYKELVAGQRSYYQLEKRYIRADGQVIWGHLTVSLVRDGGGEATHTIGMLEDVTAHKRLAADLDKAHRRLAERQEVERLRFAQELHDGALQQLFAINYQLSTYRRSLSSMESTEAVRSLDMIQQELRGLAAQLRELVRELRPPLLAEFGLTAALKEYVVRLQHERTQELPEIELDLDECGTSLPQSIIISLYRAAQEALHNVLKHAGAHHVTLSLRLLPHEVILRVRDDGCGFHVPAQLSELAQADHFGLVGIAERVEWIGGQWSIRSQPWRGTEVTVHVPWNERQENHERDDSGGPRR